MNLAGLASLLRAVATCRRPRDERGEGVLQILIGALVITTIVGGFIGFYFNVDRSSRETQDRTSAEAAAVQALNRVGRDIEEATRVLEAKSTEVVVEQQISEDEVRRVYYGLVNASDGINLVTRREVVPASSAYSAADEWDPNSTVGRAMTVESKFEYYGSNGSTTTTPGERCNRAGRGRLVHAL